jgi:hypothetical protein
MNQQTRRFKILERLGKMLALARSANKHEAETAAQLARSIMDRNGITEADLKKHDDSAYHELSMGKGFYAVWRFTLVTAAARYYGCEAIALHKGKKQRKVLIVGERIKTEAAAVFYNLLLSVLTQIEKIEAASDRFANLSENTGFYTPRECMDSFRRGIVVNMIERFIKRSPPDHDVQSCSATEDKIVAPADPKDGILAVIKPENVRASETTHKIKEKFDPNLKPIRIEEVSCSSWYRYGYAAADIRIGFEVQGGDMPTPKVTVDTSANEE